MEEVKYLQAQIKRRLREIGKTQEELARMIFVEDHEEDDDEATKRFVETLKKQLNRSSTPPEKLQRYLEILLADHRQFEVRPVSIASSYLDKKTLRGMDHISREIDKIIEKKMRS